MIELWLFELERYCSGMRVIVVCHGDIMKAIRLRLERYSAVTPYMQPLIH